MWRKILAFLRFSLQAVHRLRPLNLSFPRLRDALYAYTEILRLLLLSHREDGFLIMSHHVPGARPCMRSLFQNQFLEICVPVEELICFLLSDNRYQNLAFHFLPWLPGSSKPDFRTNYNNYGNPSMAIFILEQYESVELISLSCCKPSRSLLGKKYSTQGFQNYDSTHSRQSLQ